MGIFSTIGMVAGNWLEIKNLDLDSDVLISNICKFDPHSVRSEVKKLMTQEVTNMWRTNMGAPYTSKEIALQKLIMYSSLFASYEETEKQFQEVQKGMQKLVHIGDDIRVDIKLAARVAIVPSYDKD